MKHIFISGIPASGKSYLADMLAKKLGILHIDIDDLREEMTKDPELKKWVGFFADQDEEEYWRNISCDQSWKNLKKQSEAFWPTIKQKIDMIVANGSPAVFEGVNLLPHLMKEYDIHGVYLLGESFEAILKRNMEDPRWGNTETLQRKEAEMFYYCEGKYYKAEAEKYGYKTFIHAQEAEKELISILNS
jgi:adenylate kinase family enzyme